MVRTMEGLIVYPRGTLWRNVYRDEFVPYMHLRAVIWRHPDESRDAMQGKRSSACTSIGVWYSGPGQRRTLKQLDGEEKLGERKRFRFVARKKHSAYKECTECKRLRLAIRNALAQQQTPARIRELTEEQAAYIQWMMRQRRELERLMEMVANERMLVESSDKCGDSCLHCPTTGDACVATAHHIGSTRSLYKPTSSLESCFICHSFFQSCQVVQTLASRHFSPVCVISLLAVTWAT
ncbi:MAG: hypothetical protein SGPRY_003352 [Prymnesium sp.]